MTAPSIDQVLQAHNAIRAQRESLKRQFERQDAELERELNVLRAYLLDQLNRADAQSIKTDAGTVYRRETLKTSAADWGAVWRFAVENDAMDIFQKRLKTEFIKEYMEENDGAVPPGVNVHREFEIGVRRN